MTHVLVEAARNINSAVAGKYRKQRFSFLFMPLQAAWGLLLIITEVSGW